MNKKRIFPVLAFALLTFTGAKAQSGTMYVVHTEGGATSVVEYPVSEIDSVVFEKPLIPYHTCPNNAHPHLIDLGLSVKWACCNVGASKPEGYGDHFHWGLTTANLDDKTSYYNGTKSIQGDKDHDAATAIWGGSWVTPTKDQLEELKDNCKWEWTTENGINGYKVTSNKEGYTDASIFLPAAGWRSGTEVNNQSSNGLYWSSTPIVNENSNAWVLSFYSGSKGFGSRERYCGFTVRPVCQ